MYLQTKKKEKPTIQQRSNQTAQLHASVNGISNRWAQATEAATGINPQALGYSMRQTTESDPYLRSIGARSAIQGSTITIGNPKDIAHELGHIPDRVANRVKADTTIGGQPVCTDQSLETRADAFGANIQREYNRLTE